MKNCIKSLIAKPYRLKKVLLCIITILIFLLTLCGRVNGSDYIKWTDKSGVVVDFSIMCDETTKVFDKVQIVEINWSKFSEKSYKLNHNMTVKGVEYTVEQIRDSVIAGIPNGTTLKIPFIIEFVYSDYRSYLANGTKLELLSSDNTDNDNTLKEKLTGSNTGTVVFVKGIAVSDQDNTNNTNNTNNTITYSVILAASVILVLIVIIVKRRRSTS